MKNLIINFRVEIKAGALPADVNIFEYVQSFRDYLYEQVQRGDGTKLDHVSVVSVEANIEQQ